MQYRERFLDRVLAEAMAELPAVLVVGPRAAGKTTTASRHAATVVRLDRPGEAAAFRADPDAVLRGLEEPVLLDEWQVVPEVLGAVKRAVDEDPRPGRFLLTGSVRAALREQVWPGTGRLVWVTLHGMTVAEQLGTLPAEPLPERLASGEEPAVPPEAPDLRGYVELALRSGFPEPALRLSERARRRWLGSYVDQLVARDVPAVGGRRDPARLRRFLEAYALTSGSVVHDTTLYGAAGVEHKTGRVYEGLLGDLFVVEAVPAWSTGRLKRLVRSPKRFFLDPGLLAAVLGAGPDDVLLDGDLLGRVLETFVAAQIRGQLAASAARPRLFHLRDQNGRREVDLLVEVDGRRIVGVEVKATAAPTRADARHLAWLRDRLGEGFAAGVVLHTGSRPYVLDHRIVAAPICSLWAA